jgi:hypothetical protein
MGDFDPCTCAMCKPPTPPEPAAPCPWCQQWEAIGEKCEQHRAPEPAAPYEPHPDAAGLLDDLRPYLAPEPAVPFARVINGHVDPPTGDDLGATEPAAPDVVIGVTEHGDKVYAVHAPEPVAPAPEPDEAERVAREWCEQHGTRMALGDHRDVAARLAALLRSFASAAERRGWERACEEAARECEAVYEEHTSVTVECARRIRAMKEAKPCSG